MSDCERNCHNWVYGGIKYKEARYPNAGGSAHRRDYYDWFYCSQCEAHRLEKTGCSDDTYCQVKFGATPAPVTDFYV